MEDKVQEFLKKYEINPYAEDCFAMEEKLLSVPVEEFSDEVLEFLISNEIGIIIGLAHLDFPEKWLIRFMKYDSMLRIGWHINIILMRNVQKQNFLIS